MRRLWRVRESAVAELFVRRAFIASHIAITEIGAENRS
jgi:hypothetical protein